ncbi:MAG TPA: hypothetical protein VFA26_23170, partial [Gemmataceae bacterium]|nr:hypothetical protein [Gemmataceae bacterium]
GEIQAEVRRRQGSVALSTVSKVLRRLEDDLIVGRQSGTIRLLQEDKLLEKLVANYSPPEITGRFVGKCALAPQKLFEKLRAWADKSKEAWVGTGTYSLQMYPSVPRDEKVSLYCTNVGGVREFLGTSVQETDRFPTLEVLETQDDTVYFDPRTTAGSCRMASPLQTYLELMAGDKRDRETAERLRPLLLGALRSDPL